MQAPRAPPCPPTTPTPSEPFNGITFGITPEQLADLRDNVDEVISNIDGVAKEAYTAAVAKAIKIRDEYKQMLIDAGMTEEEATRLSAERYKKHVDGIIAVLRGAAINGPETIIPGLEVYTDGMAISFGNAADGAEAFGVTIDRLQDGGVLAYITDVNGIIEKIAMKGEQADVTSRIETTIGSIAAQTAEDAIATGMVRSEEEADAISDETSAFYNVRFANALEGIYTNPITGLTEYMGRTLAIRKFLEDIKIVSGEVDLGQLYNQSVESKIEKAKSALEKIKEALDPIVDRIISRIRNSAEEQFAERIKKVTSILEEQREAEIDAINVRVNGMNKTYGMLEKEIKAQEKKNRVLQIEKTILDAREGVAKAALGSYGENVDALDAAISRRDAEKSITEATKDAEMERSKLAIDEQQTTIAGVQTVFEIRIDIVTKALEQEKMAFFENIDDIVAKIKDGTMTGAAAVAAIAAAFKNFGITIPSTAQAIASSGTNTIGSLFAKIIAAVNAYRNKLLQVKSLEDSLGDDVDPAPTQEEITYANQVAEQERQRRVGGQISRGRVTASDSMANTFREMIHQAMYGKDGKPVSEALKKKRSTEYQIQAKKLRDSLPKLGDVSDKAIMVMTDGFMAWQKWLYSVDIVNAQPVNGPRAKGGPVRKGSTYLTGELGPELVTMGNSGEVISNFYVKRLTDTFKKLSIGNPAIMPKMAYNMGGGGKAELSVTINNPQVRSDSDIDKIVDAVNKSQMRMARRLGFNS